MSDSISCPACQRSYAFKPAFAGKRAKCKCGQEIRFPSEAPVDVHAAQGVFDTLESPSRFPAAAPKFPAAPTAFPQAPANDLASAADFEDLGEASFPCSQCSTLLPSGTILCTACGYNHQTRTALQTQVLRAPPPPPPAPVRKRETSSGYTGGEGRSGVMNVFIGGALLVIGIGITVASYSHASQEGGSYYLFYGPIVWGGIQLLRGLGQMLSGD